MLDHSPYDSPPHIVRHIKSLRHGVDVENVVSDKDTHVMGIVGRTDNAGVFSEETAGATVHRVNRSGIAM